MWLGLLARVASEHSFRANQNPLLFPSSLKLSLKQGERCRSAALFPAARGAGGAKATSPAGALCPPTRSPTRGKTRVPSPELFYIERRF